MSNQIDGRTRAGREVSRSDNAGRPARIPIGQGNKLEFDGKDPNYMYRVVNDIPGRLTMFQQAGYEFCTTEQRIADKGIAEGTAVDTRIIVNSGNGIKSYLMRIPKEYYDEDQAKKIESIKKAESQMKNKNPNPIKGEYAGLSDE